MKLRTLGLAETLAWFSASCACQDPVLLCMLLKTPMTGCGGMAACALCHGLAHAQAYNEGIEARSRMLELVPPGRVLFLRPLKRGGARVAWDAIWVHASDIIREVRMPSDLHAGRPVA